MVAQPDDKMPFLYIEIHVIVVLAYRSSPRQGMPWPCHRREAFTSKQAMRLNYVVEYRILKKEAKRKGSGHEEEE